jgi:carboxyl-terminal processing protease
VTSRFGKAVVAGLAAVFIFSLGVGVGDGRISLGFNPNPSRQLPGQLNYASVDEVYDKLRANYDGNLDEAKLLAGMKDGLAEATEDPYTTYFTPEEAKKFDEQLNNSFSGIGAELGQDKDKNLIVVAPIAGTPASKAGVKPQDIIAEIDGKSTSGLSVEEAVTKIRGPKGTDVKLQLVRNRAQTIDLTITRDDIRVPVTESRMLEGEGNIGYLRIMTFSADAGQLVAAEARKLLDAGAKKIVLDLRGNPGGRVDTSVQVASLWLPEGKIVMQEKRGSVVEKTHTAQEQGSGYGPSQADYAGNILAGVPTIVLIDGGSASASEIVAGALRDHDAARLVGEKSYGKGSVQQVVDLRDGSELKVTVARWFRPDGQNIDKKGINPDVTVKPTEEETAAGRDTQLETAQSELRK